MASQPPPESIVLGNFTGIKNVVSRERLAQGELELAINVDIDDAGQVHRRRGYNLKDATSSHSLRDLDGTVYVVRGGTLGILNPDFSFTSLGTFVGPDPLAYVLVDGVVYFSSRAVSGKIVDGAVLPWGQTGGNGQWVSPVMRPTETLGAVAGRLLGPPPLAEFLEIYMGRIYLGHDKLIWATELYNTNLVDRTKGYIQTEAPITMVSGVIGGIYVGTTRQLLFLAGTYSAGLKQTILMDAPVIKGSDVMAPAADFHPGQGAQVESGCVLFMTGHGICAGFDGGEVYNLTRGKMVFPDAVSAAALYREDQGAKAYLAVTDSAGGASGNMRIGDYAEAEIIRASDRGF